MRLAAEEVRIFDSDRGPIIAVVGSVSCAFVVIEVRYMAVVYIQIDHSHDTKERVETNITRGQ